MGFKYIYIYVNEDKNDLVFHLFSLLTSQHSDKTRCLNPSQDSTARKIVSSSSTKNSVRTLFF